MKVWTETERVISTIKREGQRAEALSGFAKALAQAQQWEWAERVVSRIEPKREQALALSELAIALVQAGEFERLLQLIYRFWLLARTRDEALQLFLAGNAFITQYPELGIALYRAFVWIDMFLKG